jgi:hypothetical protein
MLGRPIRLVATTIASALAVAISASAALACYACGGCASTYYAPPVGYGTGCGGCQQSYAPAVAYAPACGGGYGWSACSSTYLPLPVTYGQPCGAGYGWPQPSYHVDLGPTYELPVASAPEPVADYVYGRPFPPYPYVGPHGGRANGYWGYRRGPDAVAVEEQDVYGPVSRVNGDYGYPNNGYQNYGYRNYGYRNYGYHNYGYRNYGYPLHRRGVYGVRPYRAVSLHRDDYRVRGPVMAKPHHPAKPELVR